MIEIGLKIVKKCFTNFIRMEKKTAKKIKLFGGRSKILGLFHTVDSQKSIIFIIVNRSITICIDHIES
jgi:hypothetical protein